MKRTAVSLLLIASSSLVSSSRVANAQAGAPTDSGFSISPYFWLASLNGSVGVGRIATDVDLSFSDIIDHFNFGAMLTAAYRRDHWVGYVDGMYLAVGDAKAVAFRGDTGSFSLSQHETMIQPMGGYPVKGQTWAVDVLGGIRYWKLKTTLDFDRPRRTTTSSHTINMEWVDAIGGAAFRWNANNKLHFTVAGDAGGGGSDGTWQASASGMYDVWSHVSLGAAYRALSVDYDHDDKLFDTTTKGFLLQVAIRF